MDSDHHRTFPVMGAVRNISEEEKSTEPYWTNVSSGSDLSLDFTSLALYQASEILWKVCCPIILALGTFGNAMTLIVLRTMPLGGAGVSVFFSALAISDLVVLYTGLLRRWLLNLALLEIRHLHDIICKVHMFLVYLCGMTSAWFLVFMTLQRVVSVLWPHRVALLCTRRKSQNHNLVAPASFRSRRETSSGTFSPTKVSQRDRKLAGASKLWILQVTVGLTLLFLIAVNFHILVVITLRTHGDATTASCEAADNVNLQQYDTYIFPWIDLVLSSVLPSVLLIVGNSMLTATVYRSLQQAHKMTTQGSTTTRRKAAFSLTVTLISVSVAYLCLTLPVCVYVIVYDFLDVGGDVLYQAWLELVWTVCNLLWYCNCAINFYLYCLTGTKFRAQCRRLLCRAAPEDARVTATATVLVTSK